MNQRREQDHEEQRDEEREQERERQREHERTEPAWNLGHYEASAYSLEEVEAEELRRPPDGH
jgi:hypothetical protein